VFALVHGQRAALLATAATTALLVPVTLSLVPLGLAGPAYGSPPDCSAGCSSAGR